MEAGPTKPDEMSDPTDPWRPGEQSTDSSIRSPLISRIVVFGVICFGVIVAVRLGPALLGQQVLAGTDVLQTRFPWSDAGPFPTPQNWYLGDSVDATLPTYLQAFERFWSGDFALWSSLAGPGQRLIAIGNSPTLTPVSIWWILMPTDYAAGFVKLTQLAAAFAGMALWLRRVGLSWAAGVVAGLFYVGSGFITAWSNWQSQATVACLIPALFWVVERLIARRSMLSALPIALVVGFLLMGGFPASAGHALYGAGLYFIVRLVAELRHHGWKNSLRVFGLGAGGVALGVGLAAMLLLPTLTSLGTVDTAYRDAQFHTEQPWRSFLSVFYPQAMNAAAYPASNPIEAYSYVGMGAAVLAVIALVAARYTGARRGVVTFLAIGTLASAALVWKHGFWTDWLADFPVFSGSNSGRIRDVFTVFLSALAGVGFQLLVRAELPTRVRVRALIAAGASLVLFVIMTLVSANRYGERIKDDSLLQDAILGLGAVVLIVAAFVFFTRTRIRGALVGLFAAVIAVSSAVSMAYFYPTIDREIFYPSSPIIEHTQEQVGDQRMLAIGGFPGSTASAYGIRSVTGHSFYNETWAEVLNTLDPEAFTKRGRSATNPAVGLTPESGLLNNPLLDRLAVNTVYASPGREIPGNVHLLDGTPDPGVVETGRITRLTKDEPRSMQVKAQPMRAIRLWIAQTVGGKDRLTVTATVTDPAGNVVASGEVTRGAFKKTQLDIPLTGGTEIAAGDAEYTVTIGLKTSMPDFDPLVRIAAGEPSTPQLRVIAPADDGLRLIYADSNGVIWERPTALPRIRWATASIVEPELMPRLTHLVDPATPDDTVVLTEPGPQTTGRPATITTLVDTGDETSVRVDAEGAGYLVVADSVQTGYSATIDGEPADLVDADHAFGAVFVPEGVHEVSVSFTGEGMRLKTGLAISGASAIVLVLLTVGGFWWQRRRRTAATNGPGGDGSSADHDAAPPAEPEIDDAPTTAIPRQDS